MKGILILGVILAFVGLIAFQSFNVANKAHMLYTEYESVNATVENTHDNMWKTLKQKGQVFKESNKLFEKELEAYVNRGGAYKNSMMTFITENMPKSWTKDQATELMNSIEDERDKLSVKNDHANYAASNYNAYANSPSRRFIVKWLTSYPTKVEIKQITSTRSKNASETGSDDDTNLF